MSYATDKWAGQEYFKINNFEYLEFYVGNAKQASDYYIKNFGFKLIAYCGPETGIKNYVSYVIVQNKICFILTSPLNSKHTIAKWILKHGDGVSDIAFSVESVLKSYESCISRGAESSLKPILVQDDNGVVEKASIKTYGDTVHTLIDRRNYKRGFMPSFESIEPDIGKVDCDLVKIDHVVANVETDKMDVWKEYYETIFGFSTFVKFDESDISTKYSALKSVVVRSKNWKIKLPINEPAEGLRKSQIDEYLESNEGPGVQHIALLTSDIVSSIEKLRRNGVDFLDVPDTYYDNLHKRIGDVEEDIEKLRSLRILVDRDEEGYLLQLFTKPLQDRPTLFIEIIQRKGSRGFGQGNFQALFESIEKEQEKRGNL